MKAPYVVSQDISLLMKQWLPQAGFALPRPLVVENIRQRLRKVLERMFDQVEFVTETEITDGLIDHVHQSGCLPVSLDGIYLPTEYRLDICRIVDWEGNDSGMGSRSGVPIRQQLEALEAIRHEDIALIDDVVFSGAQMSRICTLLDRAGFRVRRVIAGLCIQDGFDRLRQEGHEVTCVRSYTQVVDEICERDFFPGLPRSGRQLANRHNTGLPYVLPFGRPGEWASIPDGWQEAFSEVCLENCIDLFHEITLCSGGKPVHSSDLVRHVNGLPEGECESALRLVLDILRIMCSD